MPHSVLDVPEFVRSIGVNRGSPLTVFLGAGASISSGIPSAGDCIWRWKHSIFTTSNPGLEAQLGDPSLPAVRARIDRWLSAGGLVPPDGEDEYSFYIEKCLPIADDRRQFFAKAIKVARPHVGYKLLCLMAQVGLLDSAWTTNFDGMVVRAAGEFDLIPVEIGLDSTQRTFRQPRSGELVAVSLHGDYRYDRLKNTKPELSTQDEQLRSALIANLKDHTLVVAGYSGRDQSVMRALREALLHPKATGKVFWCGYGSVPTEPVAQLLDVGAAAGRECFFVPDSSFDELMTRVCLHCLDGENKERARKIIGEANQQPMPTCEAFRIPQTDRTTLLKSNAFPVKLPAETFQFGLSEWPTEKIWKWINDAGLPFDVVAVPLRGKVLAVGTLDKIREAYADRIVEPIERVPVTTDDLNFEDSAVVCLLRRMIVRSIASGLGLGTDGNHAIWEPEPFKKQFEEGRPHPIHRAAVIALREIGGSPHITIDPTFHVGGDHVADQDAIRRIRLNLLGWQHNKEFNEDLNRWRKLLFRQSDFTDFEFPTGSAAFRFAVRGAPLFAEVAHPGRPKLNLPGEVTKWISHRGIVVPEPSLSFAPRNNQRPLLDTMPLRGIERNGPFDAGLATIGPADSIRIGVVCPRAEAGQLEAFMAESSQTHQPEEKSANEYMVTYPGFRSAYRIALDIPRRSDALWQTLPEIDPATSQRDGALQLSRNIRDAVTGLAAMGCRLVLILTPTRWATWRGFNEDDESFDVRRIVKASCVQQGIATQFLDQDTMTYADKCRIWWWLSVAIYAKAMRTPWLLNGLDPDSAYVGIGYSFDANAPKGQHLVLGCSHLYNSHGQGLQFRLTRVENYRIVQGNPFLSFDDARRIGETIRTLFWQSRFQLPNRVVLHKMTPFKRDEQLGFAAGLEGVPHLELIEVNHESAIRYIGSEIKHSKLTEAMYPVRRGTAITLSDHEALLFVHGSTDALKQNWTYFQGKRRIPGPLIIRRYAGRSDLALVCSEILGLSKMDWNSGDLYSQLPATVLSSRTIARTGTLLERFGETSYDYRLFM